MSFVSLNGARVVRGSLTLPRIGRWHADLVVDAREPLNGPVLLAFADGALVFRGTVYRGDVFQDTFHCRIVGGTNGLAKELPAKFYRGIPLRLALGDLLAEAGETLSASADATALDRLLPKWSRRRDTGATSVTELATMSDASWRFMPNGSFWIGQEGWLDVEFDHQLLREDPADGRIEIASDLPLLRPGTVFRGHRISAVVHTFGPEQVRTEAWIERDSVLDRLKGSLVSIIRSVMSDVDYHKPYPARVVVQDPDGTLHLQPDSNKIPGLTGVPIRYGVPGVTARVPAGTRCIVEFENGDSRAPIVTAFEPSTILDLSLDGGSRRIARETDTVDAGLLMVTKAAGVVTDVHYLAGTTSAAMRDAAFASAATLAASAGATLDRIDLVGTITGGAERVRA